ncbi:hypothetical protein ROSMUCSMR3_00379 [Roseovarius mucosus]|uniref:PD(D/E)XK endonuclease domain-containing protein n=1 Tax=Roseovarius mucosus TaxID=215743 RepID=A0A1V0RJE7_9RHOB|nr:hypothetical protein [Roseovarius mucosus]ARE81884.1 hypothetical protein ROSMUCSMR3_00379 [Roseovarius mucosus]
MVKDYKRYRVAQMGESLVVAELGRNGIVATSFSGNLPEADIVATCDGKTLLLQVKTMSGTSTHVKAEDLLDIELDFPKQTVTPKPALGNPDLIFVYVQLGDNLAGVKFYILTQLQLQEIIFDGYKNYLDKNDGERPRNKESKHASISIDQLANFEGNWDLIKERLGMPLDQT